MASPSSNAAGLPRPARRGFAPKYYSPGLTRRLPRQKARPAQVTFQPIAPVNSERRNAMTEKEEKFNGRVIGGVFGLPPPPLKAATQGRRTVCSYTRGACGW